MPYDVDMLVIGAGSGGLSAAKAAAKYGARVAIAEPATLGGTCVNRGCVPKKLMVSAADFKHQQRAATAYGWVNPAGSFDWEMLKAAIAQHLVSLRQSQEETLQNTGIKLIREAAQFVDPHTVALGDRQVSAEYIVLAVGSTPTVLDILGANLSLTSKDIFNLDQIPNRLAVIGGGYIGIEFSHVLAELGTEITLIDTDSLVLSGFDQDLRESAQKGLDHIGVKFIAETTCTAIEKSDKGLKVSLSGGSEQTLIVDEVLMATGRHPNIAPLKLDQASVKTDDGTIIVDQHGQTSQTHIYAVGDCVGRLPLTPVAIAEGQAVAKTIYQQQPTTVDLRWIPSAVFGFPPVATVGWSEATARERCGTENIGTKCQTFTSMENTLMDSPMPTQIKWVFDMATDQILGVHIAGHNAPEIIQGLVPALRQGLTRNQQQSTIGIHPTAAEELFSS